MPENTDTKTPHTKKNKQMLVRFGRMNQIGLFDHNVAHIPKLDTHVVVKTQKGLQLGTVVGSLSCYKGGRCRHDGRQVNAYYKASDIDMTCERMGKFIRFASHDDLSEAAHLRKIAKEKVSACQGIVDGMKLRMKIVDAEHIFGGERIIFYFMADGRVDFRELVKNLSHEFQTRIEMRQIGARDEARILGDVESCGQECCCKRFLKFLKPVNMRMAKMQKATLDPAKISGYCGRLKCCLRYEDENYTTLKKRLPNKNTRFLTPEGPGRVLNSQILTQLVIMETDKGERISVPLDELRPIDSEAPPSEAPEPKPEPRPRRERSDSRRRPKRSAPPQASKETAAPEPQAEPSAQAGSSDGTGDKQESTERSPRRGRQARRGRSGRRGRGRGRGGRGDGQNRSDRAVDQNKTGRTDQTAKAENVNSEKQNNRSQGSPNTASRSEPKNKANEAGPPAPKNSDQQGDS